MLKSHQAIFKLIEKKEPVVLLNDNQIAILDLVSAANDSVKITVFSHVANGKNEEVTETNYDASIKLACSYIQIKLEMEKAVALGLIDFIHEIQAFEEYLKEEEKQKVDLQNFMDAEDLEEFINALTFLLKGDLIMGNNAQNPVDDESDMQVTLSLDDGSEVECAILTIFELEEQNYIALLPLDEDGNENEEGEVFIYRYFEDEEGNPSLENIEDDEEYEAVADRFDELLDEAAYEDMD